MTFTKAQTGFMVEWVHDLMTSEETRQYTGDITEEEVMRAAALNADANKTMGEYVYDILCDLMDEEIVDQYIAEI